tara:strand:+ start:112 stop:885 length:774 start_codon:yes stop_codon:yes gene_type:complete
MTNPLRKLLDATENYNARAAVLAGDIQQFQGEREGIALAGQQLGLNISEVRKWMARVTFKMVLPEEQTDEEGELDAAFGQDASPEDSNGNLSPVEPPPETGPPSLNLKLFQRVDDWEMSIRTANCLVNANIVYIGDLVQMEDHYLLRLPAFGRKSLNEVKQLVFDEGFEFGMKVEGWDAARAAHEGPKEPEGEEPPPADEGDFQEQLDETPAEEPDSGAEADQILADAAARVRAEELGATEEDLLDIPAFLRRQANA